MEILIVGIVGVVIAVIVTMGFLSTIISIVYAVHGAKSIASAVKNVKLDYHKKSSVRNSPENAKKLFAVMYKYCLKTDEYRSMLVIIRPWLGKRK